MCIIVYGRFVCGLSDAFLVSFICIVKSLCAKFVQGTDISSNLACQLLGVAPAFASRNVCNFVQARRLILYRDVVTVDCGCMFCRGSNLCARDFCYYRGNYVRICAALLLDLCRPCRERLHNSCSSIVRLGSNFLILRTDITGDVRKSVA